MLVIAAPTPYLQARPLEVELADRCILGFLMAKVRFPEELFVVVEENAIAASFF